jgi:hypothetical protein
MTLNDKHINPLRLSLVSTPQHPPQHPAHTHQPSPSVDQSPSPPDTSELAAPSRKRARSDLSPEEKREARAHRNRIAAQNSRDRRKVQFQHLEQRVAELEDENRRLRGAMVATSPELILQSTSERDKARERENQELRERIKVLEQGWASVVQALASAGQAIPALGLPPSITQSNPAPSAAGSSRASSPASVKEEVTAVASTSVSSTPSLSFSALTATTDGSTRHLARMANVFDSLISVPKTPLQRVEIPSIRTPLRALPLPSTPQRRHHRQMPRSMLGYKTSCNQSRLLPLQRRRLLFLLLLRSATRTRPPRPK